MRTTKLVIGLLASTLLSGCYQQIQQYEDSWEHNAHALQRQLDANQPLVRSTFFGTHNSYNASSYTTTQRYIDPNQSYGIKDQLRMDIRALELDVHSFFSFNEDTETFEPALKLCHGMGNHLGCSPWDLSFREGLLEVSDWLSEPDNQNEVLLIYIEDHIGIGDYQKAIAVIEETIGEYVYRPEGSGCDYIPAETTRNTIIGSGKNIILISDGCNNAGFNLWVHGGFENGPRGYPTANVDNLLASSECIDNKFSRSQIENQFIRLQEDRTILSNLAGVAAEKVTPDVVRQLTACEINLIGMDKLKPFDGRLTAAIWSWDSDQPATNSSAACAVHNDNNRFETEDCDEQRHFACQDPNTEQWFISEISGSWSDGEAACEALGLNFTVPKSGYDNQQLAQVKNDDNQSDIWLGYKTEDGALWQVF
ncbi:MAG: hypothetical protein MI867_29375 [Pseudomonadales bacterium]|nr:hypothetical protein [Pseudomonadales bacterium]